MRSKKKTNEWKLVPTDTAGLNAADLEFFGGIEELTDYEILKPAKKRKRDSDDGLSIKKKRKKLKNTEKITQNEVENAEIDNSQAGNAEELDMSGWCNCFVPDEVLRALRDLKFDKPTEIQELALPPAIRDHQDILAAAETGSGKTLAFGIPVITHIMAAKSRENSEDTQLKSLVLAPTRELAIQVKNHLQAVTKYIDIKIVCIVGGMALQKQRRLLQKCPEIIVATPGRLWQLMEENEPYLSQIPFVRYLVIDEADRMVERGHFEELKKILEIINENKKCKRRQNFVFSATLTMIHDLPKRLELKRKKGKVIQKHKLESLMSIIGIREKPKIIDITRKTGLVETLTESQIRCSLEEKDTYLYYFIVMHPGRTLVFCNSINCVRRLKSVFDHLNCHPLTLHASMHQRQRLKNLETFTASQSGILFATDVAARGLDIQGIEHVVHFQVPRTAEIYVHRSGRTARAQKEGLSLMLIEPQEAAYYNKICKTLNKERTLPAFPVDHSVLKIVKERVSLARQIDIMEHRMERLAAQNRWFLKAAEEMDADIEDENLLNELGNDREKAQKSHLLKSMKKQLAAMLKRPLVTKMFTGSYPTRLGKFMEPTVYGKEKALKAMKKDRTLLSSPQQKSKKKRRRQ